MRMKARMIGGDVLLRMAQSVERLDKKWVLRMTPTHLHFVVCKSQVQSGLQVWATLLASTLFNSYVIESIRGNEIWMECSTEHFVRALKSAHHSTNVVMKLTKKQEMPFLSLHITRQSRSGKPFVLVQDIPVCILQDTRIQELQEPLIPGADVNIVLPRLSHFKPLMDRIKSISLPLTLYANNHGELGIRAVNDGVRVETCYRDLVNPSLNPNHPATQATSSMSNAPSRTQFDFVEATVDARDMSKFLQCYILSPSHVVCSIFENKCIVMDVAIGTSSQGRSLGNMTYLLPARME